MSCSHVPVAALLHKPTVEFLKRDEVKHLFGIRLLDVFREQKEGVDSGARTRLHRPQAQHLAYSATHRICSVKFTDMNHNSKVSTALESIRDPLGAWYVASTLVPT